MTVAYHDDPVALAPMGMPFESVSIIVGYAQPISTHLRVLLNDGDTSKRVKMYILTYLQKQGVASLMLKSSAVSGLFRDLNDYSQFDLPNDFDLVDEFFSWTSHLQKEFQHHRVSRWYRNNNFRMMHDYALCHPVIDFYVDKLVITLEAYYPDDEPRD